jgi:hypothetical protein
MLAADAQGMEASAMADDDPAKASIERKRKALQDLAEGKPPLAPAEAGSDGYEPVEILIDGRSLEEILATQASLEGSLRQLLNERNEGVTTPSSSPARSAEPEPFELSKRVPANEQQTGSLTLSQDEDWTVRVLTQNPDLRTPVKATEHWVRRAHKAWPPREGQSPRAYQEELALLSKRAGQNRGNGWGWESIRAALRKLDIRL